MVSHFNFPSTLRVICFYALHSPLLCFSYVPRTTSVSQIFVFLDVLHRDMPNVTISNIHLQSCNQMSRRGSVSLNTSKWCTYVRNIDEIKLGASTLIPSLAGLSFTAFIPRLSIYFLAVILFLDNGSQVPATEGSQRCSPLVKRGDQRCGQREGRYELDQPKICLLPPVFSSP